MPITIQEIIASDTISQLVDKTNFNFDQLLLNGGGPAGPAGPAGPIGPAGGRGPKGTTWYEDTSSTLPGNLPTVVPPTATPRESDYYLQLNGQVWEYTGLTWSITTINLTGPTGPAGASGGFGLSFGSPSIGLETALYNGPFGEGNGATGGPGGNEGIPSIMIGGAVTTTNPLSTIGLTNAYIIPNTVAEGLISTYASLMIHQKDSTARSIVFHGGAATPSDKYYQGDIFGLSSISIGVDDKLFFDVPRQPTTPAFIGDLVGFEVNIPKRSQQYTAGKAITFQTGIEADPYLIGENSDFLINVGTGSNPAGNKFVLTTSGSNNATLIQAGGGFTPVTAQNSQNGVIQLQSGLIQLTSSVSENIQLNSGGNLKLDTTQGTSPSGQISLTSGVGGISLTATGGTITSSATLTSNVFAGGRLNLNGDRILIGEDLNSIGTQSIRLATTDISNVEGIKLLSGKPAASAVPVGSGIILQTFGASENIKIVAENPGVSGGVTISSGPGVGNSGFVSIASHIANIITNSDDGDTLMQVSSKPLIKLTKTTGEIILGGVTTGQLSGNVSLYKPMIIASPNENSLWDPGTSPQLPRIQVGHKPALAANLTGIAPFCGGAEIRGPYGQSYAAMGSNPTINERQGALHIKSGTDGNGRNPGAVYVYTGENTGTSQGGSYVVNSVRLWASAKSMPFPQSPTGSPPAGNRGATGLTMGLNQNMESAATGGGTVPSPGTPNITNGANVEGRILLYGTRNNSQRATNDIVQSNGLISPDTVLDQNTPYPHANGVYNYGGVNIGDQYRGRQQFKVFGDIIGDYYTSEFGGSYSGPNIEAQAILSGAQTWSNKTVNLGTNNLDDDLAFQYKYQWQRVGRVVTGSGFVRLFVSFDGGSNTGIAINNGAMFTPAVSNFNSQMKIGPIPLPMQVNYDGANSQDGGIVFSLRGAQAANISGTVTSKFDFDNQITNTLGLNRTINGGSITGINYNGPFPTGDVRGGTSTTDSGMNPSTSTLSTHLWLSVLSNFSNSYTIGGLTFHGMYSPMMAFTFSYEINQS